MKTAVFVTAVCILGLSTSQETCPKGCSSCNNGRVQCPGAQFKELPTTLPADTLSLDFTQNQIDSLENMPQLSEVQSLRMSMNQLTVVKGDAFKSMPSLVSMDLSMNKISKVYKHGFRGLDNVMSISLSGNKLSEIGLIFKNTPQLTSVRLGNNEIEEITEDNFQDNPMIKMLDLSSNKISKIHKNAFKNMDMLRYLILTNNPIKTATDLVFTSTMLSLVDFSNCALTSVPRKMPSSLVDYRLGNNMIETIHVEDFENITSLKMLTLNDNKISHVDHRSFGTLASLKELWLSRNDLVYIPRGLPKGLQKLFMDNNVVVELEQMLFHQDSDLVELILEGNKIHTIHPEAMKDISKLQKLDLQGNDIERIQAGTFTNVPNLESLILTDNPIGKFDTDAFSDLTALTELHLSYVEPNEMPDEIVTENFFDEMPNLQTVDMMSSPSLTNEVLEILHDTEVQPLENLKKWNLQYNELVTLPEELKTILPNIKQLLLDGNLLACDTRLRWLNEWMTGSSVSFHQYDKPTCDTPKSLKGQEIDTLSPGDFKEPEPEQPQSADETAPVQQQTNSEPNQDTATNQDTDQPQQQITHYNMRGTVVKIKPPSGSSPSQTRGSTGGAAAPVKPSSTSSSSSTGSQTKLTKKELRRLERERRRKLKEERKRLRKLRNKRNKNGDEDSKRKKRRIKKTKDCGKDANGEKKCGQKKKCKVLEDGSVRCRKRKTKKEKKEKST